MSSSFLPPSLARLLEQRTVVLEMYFVQIRYTNIKFDSIRFMHMIEAVQQKKATNDRDIDREDREDCSSEENSQLNDLYS